MALPPPIEELLAVWRQWRRGDIEQTRAELTGAGFQVTWAADLASLGEEAGLTR